MHLEHRHLSYSGLDIGPDIVSCKEFAWRGALFGLFLSVDFGNDFHIREVSALFNESDDYVMRPFRVVGLVSGELSNDCVDVRRCDFLRFGKYVALKQMGPYLASNQSETGLPSRRRIGSGCRGSH